MVDARIAGYAFGAPVEEVLRQRTIRLEHVEEDLILVRENLDRTQKPRPAPVGRHFEQRLQRSIYRR